MIKELLEVIGDCKSQDICTCITKHSFETITSTVFYIFDEGGNTKNPVKVVNPENDYQLTVRNPSEKQIILGKLDNCLINDDHSKCDCLLYNNDKVYFVEIKSSSTGTRGQKRRKAYKQLGSTITYFVENNIPLNKQITSAVICFKSMEPKIINSANNTARAVFLETYGVTLEEKNVLFFE